MPDTAAHVWLVEAAEEDAYIKAHVLATLPVGEVRRLSAVLAPQRYHRLCAQAALRQLAAAFVGSTPLMVGIERGRDGKPLLGGVGGAHLSLAHSGRFAAVALCTAGPVGVDVELPRAPSDSAGLARTILSGPEYDRWLGLAEPDAGQALLRSWTHKEAVLKALGTGLAGDVRAVSTRPDERGLPVLESLPPGAGAPDAWTLRDLSAGYGLPTAVAVAAPGVQIRLHRTRLRDLLRGRGRGEPMMEGA
jgi:4'-phosphopantetheinyl transferase